MLLVVCQLSSDAIGWKSLAKKGKEYFSFFILCPELRTLTRELSPDAQAKKSHKKLRIGRESNPRYFSANPVAYSMLEGTTTTLKSRETKILFNCIFYIYIYRWYSDNKNDYFLTTDISRQVEFLLQGWRPDNLQ